MRSTISFVLDNQLVTEDFSREISPTTTLLNYLRSLPSHRGVKEGCAEGDCGACTIALGDLHDDGTLRYRAVDSCLVFLPMIHGKHLVTVENLKSRNGDLHPVQQAMVETGGSQCGYCTPGIIMSMFALYKHQHEPTRAQIDDALTGNLCRCTGYRPIIEATARSCAHLGEDSLADTESGVATLLRSLTLDSALLETEMQRYLQPSTLQEALVLLNRYPDAIVISGATDIALRVTKKHELLDTIIDISFLNELKHVQSNALAVHIGANLPLTDVVDGIRTDFPALADLFAVFGSLQIRNLATLGGNIGSASPIGDSLSALVAHNATIVLQNVAGKRAVALNDFVTGYRQTVRKHDELITEIIVPKVSSHSVVRLYKISKRKDLDISTLSAGFRLDFDNSKRIHSPILAYGGMAERVKRAVQAEDFLMGRFWTRDTVEQAMTIIDREFTPISDVRGSAAFRRVAARNLLLKFWSETADGMNGRGG